MTYWQKLVAQYPDLEKYGPKNKKVKCPSSWGYEERIKGECSKEPSCEACWNREIPEKRDS